MSCKILKKSYPTECNILLSEDVEIAADIINRNFRPRGSTTFKEWATMKQGKVLDIPSKTYKTIFLSEKIFITQNTLMTLNA